MRLGDEAVVQRRVSQGSFTPFPIPACPVRTQRERANRLTLHVLAAAAEHERHMIGERTRQALAAAKARGIKRGNPEQAKINRSRAAERAQVLRPHLEGCIKAGCTSRAVPSQRISTRAALRHQMANDFPMQVRRVRDRLGL